VRRAGRLLATLAFLPVLLAADRPSGLGDVVKVRHWSFPGFTRVLLEVSRPVRTEVRRLPADEEARRPERLYLDLDGVWIGRRFGAPIPVGDGLLRAIRLGQNTLTRTRLVVDLERYDRHRLLVLSAPDRVVLDVFAAPRDAPPPGGEARLPSDLRPVRTVVVDAGHGGRDPGASGHFGLVEKDLTLRMARLLRPRLEAMGFQVVMTRDGDETLSLEERTALAEGADGDVFLSLHANSAPRPALHGIEIWHLDRGHSRHALRVAARENHVSPGQLDDLQRALARLRVAEASDHSAQLADSVHRAVLGGLRRRWQGVADLGVKAGPFYVLFLSDMPAILVESGFITHRDEARRLRSPAYLETLVDRIALGVADYRDRRSLMVAGGQP
jgi:N-acetylmuramoyl-L-alanine amidase